MFSIGGFDMDISKYVDINHTIGKEMFEECDDFIKIIPKIRDWVIIKNNL